MKSDAAEVHIRRMSVADVSRVFMIAWSRKHATHWPREAYLAALKPDATPQRIALVAEDPADGRGPLLLDWKAPNYEEPEKSPPSDGKAESGRVVGFLIASVLAPQSELESIAVSAAEQRRGVGRRLFLAMAEALRAAGVNEVFLEVRASNQRAFDFYRSLGWNETGRRPRYYADPEEDAVLMSLKLE